MPLRVRVGYDSAALALHHAQRSPAGGALQGLMGFFAVYAANLSTAQHLAAKAATNKFYGMTL